MVTKNYKNITLSRLGMGVMRLPQTDDGNGGHKIDYPESHKIIDKAYEQGINYFDTAYVYNGGDSERCLGACMVKHPRESFYLATKFNLGANPDYKDTFATQLERLQTSYIDFYLMHCIVDNNRIPYAESGAIEYFDNMKKEGKIKYLGFSHHGSIDNLRKSLELYDWDFVQLQFNFYDYLYGQAKEEYEIVKAKNIPIMVMEPVRGGRLSALTPETEALLKAAHPDWSVSSWALRFVASFDGIQVALSGMSTMGQLEDNLKTFSSEPALSDEDMNLLKEVCAKFKNQIQVPCTGCNYCENCPVEINIPAYLTLYNNYKVNGWGALGRADKIESKGKPSDCIGCGACTGHCPQNIDTPSIMKDLANLLKK